MASLEIFVKGGVYALMIAGSLASLGAVFLPNIFHAGLSLVLVLLCTAGVYVSAGAEFLAMVQILIYVGAVMTLVIYAIMLTNMKERKASHLPKGQIAAAVLAAGGFFALLASLILKMDWPALRGLSRLSVQELGSALMSRYIFPFEVLGIILFAVLIGAIVIARRDTP